MACCHPACPALEAEADVGVGVGAGLLEGALGSNFSGADLRLEILVLEKSCEMPVDLTGVVEEGRVAGVIGSTFWGLALTAPDCWPDVGMDCLRGPASVIRASWSAGTISVCLRGPASVIRADFLTGLRSLADPRGPAAVIRLAFWLFLGWLRGPASVISTSFWLFFEWLRGPAAVISTSIWGAETVFSRGPAAVIEGDRAMRFRSEDS